MSPLALPADAEALLRDFLIAQPEVGALVGSRVHTSLPATPVYPLVLEHRAGGTSRDQGVLDRPLVQLEAWAAPGKHGDAVAVMSTLRAVLGPTRAPGSYARGEIAGAEEISGPTYLPDQLTLAERFVMTVRLFTRP